MRVLLVLGSLVAIGGCTPETGPSERIGGLLRSDSSFVMSPDRCTISLLYDNYRIELPRPARTQNPMRFFVISGGGGEPIALEYRGTFDGPTTVAPTISLKIAGRTSTHSVKVDEDRSFFLHVEDRLSASGETPVEATATLSGNMPAGESALLVVQSVDVSVRSGGKGPC